MTGAVPPNPAIYHITHVDNLRGIVRDGCIWSDSARAARSLHTTNIGHHHIKERRLRKDVLVAAGGKLGDYVPFYFCSRSVMLYAIHCGHQDYNGGQEGVIHLVSSINTALHLHLTWAFTDRHAELGYAMYFDDLNKLTEIDWQVMPLQWWSGSRETKEKRQAEFLVHGSFPWCGIERIAAYDSLVAQKTRLVVGPAGPPVDVRPEWYYPKRQ